MRKMTKWLAVCAVCVMGSVPAMAAEVPDVTVTPIPIETPAPAKPASGHGEVWKQPPFPLLW